MLSNPHIRDHIRQVTRSQNFKMAEASGGVGSSSSDVETSDGKMERSVNAESQKEKPTCILCLGMAGSGKTTFVQVFKKTGLGSSLLFACESDKLQGVTNRSKSIIGNLIDKSILVDIFR